jgi:NitT/TauT family transport system permease protein
MAARRLLGEALVPVGTLLAALALWEAATRIFKIPRFIMPAPSAILGEGWEWRYRFIHHTWVTLYETLGGFAMSVVVGVPIAVGIVYSPLLRRVIYPLIVVLNSVPKIALAPLFLIWIGHGLVTNVIVATIVAFLPMVVNTAAGLESVEPDLLQLTRSLRAGTLQVFWKVRLPWALPHVFSGMKVAMSLAVIGAVVGEFVGSDKGLGYLIIVASSNLNTAVVFGVMAALSILGVLVFWAVVVAERLICPWYIQPDPDRQ